MASLIFRSNEVDITKDFWLLNEFIFSSYLCWITSTIQHQYFTRIIAYVVLMKYGIRRLSNFHGLLISETRQERKVKFESYKEYCTDFQLGELEWRSNLLGYTVFIFYVVDYFTWSNLFVTFFFKKKFTTG